MQFPIIVGLRRSFLLGVGVFVAHGAVAAGAWLTPWPENIRMAAWGASAFSLAYAFWRWKNGAISALRLDGEGRLACRLTAEAEWQDAELLAGATVHPWLTAFRIRCGERVRHVLVAADSTAPEDFRRLRAWLRWRADFSPLPPDAA